MNNVSLDVVSRTGKVTRQTRRERAHWKDARVLHPCCAGFLNTSSLEFANVESGAWAAIVILLKLVSGAAVGLL